MDSDYQRHGRAGCFSVALAHTPSITRPSFPRPLGPHVFPPCPPAAGNVASSTRCLSGLRESLWIAGVCGGRWCETVGIDATGRPEGRERESGRA